jgi:hypothetical protein
MTSNIGKIRLDLAKLLSKSIPNLSIPPDNLHKNTPYLIKYVGCCSWDAYGNINGIITHIYSFYTMKHCLKNGFNYTEIAPFDFEIVPK